MDLPESVPGDVAICARIQCPVELLPERVMYAGLELYSASPDPAGLRGLEETVIELRPVLSPARLPRSPVGFPLACPTGECAMTLPSTRVRESFFTTEVGTRVDFPMTRYVRDLLREDEPGRVVVPNTLVLMNGIDSRTGLELRPLQYSTFGGPGSATEPSLRIVLTISEGFATP
jgi:hypothetical protein